MCHIIRRNNITLSSMWINQVWHHCLRLFPNFENLNDSKLQSIYLFGWVALLFQLTNCVLHFILFFDEKEGYCSERGKTVNRGILSEDLQWFVRQLVPLIQQLKLGNILDIIHSRRSQFIEFCTQSNSDFCPFQNSLHRIVRFLWSIFFDKILDSSSIDDQLVHFFCQLWYFIQIRGQTLVLFTPF